MGMVALYLAPLVAVQRVGHRDEVAHDVLGRLRLAWTSRHTKGDQTQIRAGHTYKGAQPATSKMSM